MVNNVKTYDIVMKDLIRHFTSDELAKLTPFEKFIATRHSLETRKGYIKVITGVVKDPDAFLRLAIKDRKRAEDMIIRFIQDRKAELEASTMHTQVATVKSFLDYHEVTLAWKQVRDGMPRARRVAKDRPPDLAEIQAMLKFADSRSRFIILLLASSGGRIGMFYFPRERKSAYDFLRIADLSIIDYSTRERFTMQKWLDEVSADRPLIGKIQAYTDEAESYSTFFSPEAVKALRDYLEARKRVGEAIGDDSPVIRDAFAWNGGTKDHPEEARSITTGGIAVILDRLKRRAGITANSTNGGFKRAHGFRKWFRTQLRETMKTEHVELLMGHAQSYQKPSDEKLEQEYVAALPHIVVTETSRITHELKTVKTGQSEEIKELRSTIDRQELRNLRFERERDETNRKLDFLMQHAGLVAAAKKDAEEGTFKVSRKDEDK